MQTTDQIDLYLASIPEPKQSDMRRLHGVILKENPACQLWFKDGKDERGKVVSNPSIGYSALHTKTADGRVSDTFRVGISANTSGITVYIMGMADRNYLRQTYAHLIGKASVTGYCIKFKALKDVDMGVLVEAIQDGLDQSAFPLVAGRAAAPRRTTP